MNQFQNYLFLSSWTFTPSHDWIHPRGENLPNTPGVDYPRFTPSYDWGWFRICIVILNLIQNLYRFRVKPGMTERTPGRNEPSAAPRNNSDPTSLSPEWRLDKVLKQVPLNISYSRFTIYDFREI